MTGIMGVISYGLGTVIGFVLIGVLVFWVVQHVTQKKRTVRRNYPVIGRLRFVLEVMGGYFRQYCFAGDRDEMPFNRATRGWVYKKAKNEGGIIGFTRAAAGMRASSRASTYVLSCSRTKTWRSICVVSMSPGRLPRCSKNRRRDGVIGIHFH